MSVIDWKNAPTFEPPTKFEQVLEDFYHEMEDSYAHKIGNIDGGDVYAVTVELDYMAHWFDRLQWAYDEERKVSA